MTARETAFVAEIHSRDQRIAQLTADNTELETRNSQLQAQLAALTQELANRPTPEQLQAAQAEVSRRKGIPT
jgi:cell division protein FtsB